MALQNFGIKPNNLLGLSTIILAFFLFLPNSLAQSQNYQQKKFNYFVSLRSNETNVRSGPGRIYPIKFTYKAKNIPLIVIGEYDNWNEIKDYEGQTGWISKSLLTKKRSLMIRTSKSYVKMHSKQNEKSRIIYKVENNVIGKYLKCSIDWCKIEIEGKEGWIKKTYLFGYL